MQTTTANNNSKQRKKQLIAVCAVVALAMLSVQAYSLVTGASLLSTGRVGAITDPPSNSTITVTGDGQVTVQPDIAYLTIGVDTTSSSAQSAAQQNANSMASVISALENLGINASSIQTISYNIYQNQQNVYPLPVVCSTPLNVTTCGGSSGYEVDNEIQVTVSVTGLNLSQLGVKVGAAIDAAVAAGANEVYGVQFSASNYQLSLANEQALKLASSDAFSQASTVATALGVKITGVVSVTTSPYYTPSPIAYDIPGAAATSSNETPVVPQSLSVSATVQVVYAISN